MLPNQELVALVALSVVACLPLVLALLDWRSSRPRGNLGNRNELCPSGKGVHQWVGGRSYRCRFCGSPLKTYRRERFGT